jgi:xylan 1,4-beta-xylosidase
MVWDTENRALWAGRHDIGGDDDRTRCILSQSDFHLEPRNEAQIHIHADQRKPLRRIWRFVGYDEPNYTYTPGGQELLSKLGHMSDAPYYIRCHFLLCSGDGTGQPKWGSTNAYTEGADGQPIYQWKIVDRILDIYIEAGCVPFVEIGFMPRALSSAPPGTPYTGNEAEGWRYPPRDYGRWMDLVHVLATHCLQRYGLREVSRWYWELWNEPDISYWRGSVEEYCRLYDYTVAGLLSALPQAKIGGPGTTSPGRPAAAAFLKAFLEHCVCGTNAVTGQTGTRLDYISFHTKGGGYSVEPHAPKKTPTMHTLIRHVVAGLDIITSYSNLLGHEVILSECDPDGWAAGSIRDNPNLFYRNTEYYASYLACAVCKLIDLAHSRGPRVDGVLTWAFQFEDREYFAGLRTLSTNGVDKPILNVFRLLAQLGGTRLHLISANSRNPMRHEIGDDPHTPPDVSGIAAMNERGGIQVFLSSHHDDWDTKRPTVVRIRLSGLEPGRTYSVWRQSVDESHGNAHTAWTHMGKPQPPDKAQLVELHNASRLKAERLPGVSSIDGTVELQVTASTHSASLLELVPEV